MQRAMPNFILFWRGAGDIAGIFADNASPRHRSSGTNWKDHGLFPDMGWLRSDTFNVPTHFDLTLEKSLGYKTTIDKESNQDAIH